MSVYRPAKSPFFAYDFKIRGRRFFGSTKATNKKDAQAVERDVKAQAKTDLENEKKTGSAPMTLDIAAGRYWQEVGQYHKRNTDTYRDIQGLIDFFGKDKRLDSINDSDVAAFVAWKRSQPRKHAKKSLADKRFIAPATVNRTALAPLKAILIRARKTWRQQLPSEPSWRSHWLKTPEERVRELYEGEGEALDAAVREDYADWFEFARLTGLRRNETLIRWENVNWLGKIIVTRGKRDLAVRTPITPTVKAILARCRGHHPEYVFTYVCQQTHQNKLGEKWIKGHRYPITPEGAKTQWRRLKIRSGVTDFRFHDLRHDVGTKLLRLTGNLRLVQQALNHRDIKTTTKYAHVQNDELASALEYLTESRNKFRNKPDQVA